MTWKLLTVVYEGMEVKIDGVNVWSQKWLPVRNQFAQVRDPSYDQPFSFQVYTIHTNGVVSTFAAGEFSNGVWGFYTLAD